MFCPFLTKNAEIGGKIQKVIDFLPESCYNTYDTRQLHRSRLFCAERTALPFHDFVFAQGGVFRMPHSDYLFSVSLFGFSREEVAAYIAEMNRSFKESGAKHESQIALLNEELEKLRLSDAKCGEIQKAVADKEEKITALEEEIARLKNDTENARLAVAAAEDHAKESENTARQLKTDLEAERIKASAMEANAKEYDSMLADVNGILSTARRKAEELIAEAEKRAAQIVADAEKRAQENADEIVAASDEKVAENMKKVKYLYRRKEELDEIFKDHKSKVDAFFSSLPAKESE